MPKVHFVKAARKPDPSYGIEVGQSYYYWSFKLPRGGYMVKSKTRPKPSQLTRSEFWSAVYRAQEDYSKTPDFDDLETQRDELVADLQNIVDETQGKYDNLPDGLQQGQTGEMLQERVEAVESAINEIEGVDLTIDEGSDEESSEDEKEEAKTSRAEEIWQEITDAVDGVGCS